MDIALPGFGVVTKDTGKLVNPYIEMVFTGVYHLENLVSHLSFHLKMKKKKKVYKR